MSKDGKKKGYEVGYGKPPKNNRFGAKNSNPRNKKGRPKGRNVLEFGRLSEEAFWHCFHDSAQKSVNIIEDDQEMSIPLIMVIAKSMAKDAANGDKYARRDYLKYLEKSVKGKDKLVLEMYTALASHKERILEASGKKGSLKHFNAMYAWFMSKKALREMNGGEDMQYEEGEPRTNGDWAMFFKYHEALKSGQLIQAPWPLEYPSDKV